MSGTIFKPNLFDKKVALVTGGGTGIGKAIAQELVSLGATVVLASRKKERLEAAVNQLNSMSCPGKAHCVEINIRDEASVKKGVQEVITKFGKVDYLVNNGGGQFPSKAAGLRPKGWRAVIDTNLNGTWYMTQAVYLLNPEPRRGMSVINIIADYFNGFPGMAHTGAARAAVDNLTKTLAREWGTEGIRVNSVCPGFICSSGVESYAKQLRPRFVAAGNSVPLARTGTESEVAAATVFLLSPGAHYITGTTLRVDGGGSLYKADFIPAPKADPKKTIPAFHLDNTLKSEYEKRVNDATPSIKKSKL